ncbi:MAG: M50 family metallopeptidase, partial [Deltaproteobacteria bacterium]|nr:M50 family metallopeptidase [Deltaproteobacteria bacterium]
MIRWLKWPLAFISLIFLPGVIYALTFVIEDLAHRPRSILPLLAGAGAFLLVWLAVLRPHRSRHHLVTIEHEFTHALFAWLTLHRVTGLRAALAGGGHIGYEGRGNWLIAIAPFVVPVFALCILVLSIWVDSSRVISALLGLTLAWNVVANWSATHRHHGDHREAGGIFAFLFVTCSNVLVLGLALTYATQAHSLTGHLSHVLGPSRAFFGWLVKLLNPA